jgi:hypothetical protein
MKASRTRRPFGGADRDVLQVRVVARQPPGHRDGLRIGRVDAAGLRVHHQRQLVGVGALQLREAAVLEQLARQRVVGGELLQHVLVGRRRAARGLAADRQAELAEQDLADLLRAAEVERLARELVGLLLERRHALGELVALRVSNALSISTPVRSIRPRISEHRHLDAPVDVGDAGLGIDQRREARCTSSARSLSSHAYSAARPISTCDSGIWFAPLPQTSS